MRLTLPYPQIINLPNQGQSEKLKTSTGSSLFNMDQNRFIDLTASDDDKGALPNSRSSTAGRELIDRLLARPPPTKLGTIITIDDSDNEKETAPVLRAIRRKTTDGRNTPSLRTSTHPGSGQSNAGSRKSSEVRDAKVPVQRAHLGEAASTNTLKRKRDSNGLDRDTIFASQLGRSQASTSTNNNICRKSKNKSALSSEPASPTGATEAGAEASPRSISRAMLNNAISYTQSSKSTINPHLAAKSIPGNGLSQEHSPNVSRSADPLHNVSSQGSASETLKLKGRALPQSAQDSTSDHAQMQISEGDSDSFIHTTVDSIASASEGYQNTSINSVETDNRDSGDSKNEFEILAGQASAALERKEYYPVIYFYTQAQKIAPLKPLHLSNRAYAYCCVNQHELARKDAEIASAADPGHSNAWSILGMAKLALSDTKGSVEAYKAAIDAHGNGGTNHMKRGYEKAKEQSERASKPANSQAETSRDIPKAPEASSKPKTDSDAIQYQQGNLTENGVGAESLHPPTQQTEIIEQITGQISTEELSWPMDSTVDLEKEFDIEQSRLLDQQISEIIQSTEQVPVGAEREMPLLDQQAIEATKQPLDVPLEKQYPGSDFYPILQKHIKEMQNDYGYMTKISLGRARSLKRPTFPPLNSEMESASPNGMMGFKHTVSPFQDMQPIQQTTHSTSKKAHDKSTVYLAGESFTPTGTKEPKYFITAPVTSWEDDSSEVPEYMQSTSVNRNLLGINMRQLQVWPFFSEEEVGNTVLYNPIKEEYDVVVDERPRKVVLSQKARSYEPYFEAFLEEVGCSMDGVLKYLLDYDLDGENGLRNKLLAVAVAYEVPNADASVKKILMAREKSCNYDYDCHSERWISFFSSLPSIDDQTLWRSAVACWAFFDLTRFSPWQIARKHARFPDEDPGEEGGSKTFRDFTCSVCHLHDCPYHGENREFLDPEDEAERQSRTLDSLGNRDPPPTVDELDVDFPPEINFKQRIIMPVPLEDDGFEAQLLKTSGKEKSISWWMNESNSVTWDHSKRGPFFPCFHPGWTCEGAHCSCYREKVCCEKICGCSLDCDRRFKGCSCSQGKRRKLCSQDESCDCFRMNRECDPDLCRSCGVHAVLDPVNRYEEDIQKGKCYNAAIQLGRPKRTLLGNSQVHGFGLYAGESIKKGDFVGEYRGEIITKLESERRWTIYEPQKLSYLFALNKDQQIDSQRMGNKIRFINHAAAEERKSGRKANLRNIAPKIVFCNMTHRIGMYAIKDINIGDEFFFDYGKDYHTKLYGDNNEPDSKVVSKAHNRSFVKGIVEAEDEDGDTDFDGDDDDQPIKLVRASRKQLAAVKVRKPVFRLKVAKKSQDASHSTVDQTTQGPSHPRPSATMRIRNPKAAIKTAETRHVSLRMSDAPIDTSKQVNRYRGESDGLSPEEDDDSADEEEEGEPRLRRSRRSRKKSFKIQSSE